MYNPVSRFISEIPEKLIEKRGGGQADGVTVRPYGGSAWGSRGAEAPVSQPRTYYTDRSTPARTEIPRARASAGGSIERVTVGKTPAAKGTPQKPLAAGDRVRHMTFGEGEILSVKAMGADVLYEVAFDRVGTKKLMGTYAKLTKV